jgi:hypothetical protein
MTRPAHLPMAKLAYRDLRFMESLPARPLRILAEYIDPLQRLRRARVADTIVIFGSARIYPRDTGLKLLEQTRKLAKGGRTSGAQKFKRRSRWSKCRAITKRRASYRSASRRGP